MQPSTRRLVIFACLALAVISSIARAADVPPGSEVDIILWFDTEDYLSPSDDDAAKRLADLLTARHIRATFKLVGEKARVLEQRKRTDVIESLNRHDIGYHANFHSVHPTVAEYEQNASLLDGMAEFVRREGSGAADVRRIFGRKTLACYGQPGSSWAAQAIAALPACGILADGVPCYVDGGDHVGFGGQPFWFAGALVVYKMRPNETRMNLFAEGGLEEGRKQVGAIIDRLRFTGGGLVSIYYHPCEWVTSQFWDGANFTRGANPPREQWKLPAQRPREETDRAFARFEAYIDFIRAQPGVQFVTASELPGLYPDRVRTEGLTIQELSELARRLQSPDPIGIDDMDLGGKTLSPADQFQALSLALARRLDPAPATPTTDPLRLDSLLGPDAPPPVTGGRGDAPVPWPAFAAAVSDARDYMRINHRIPSEVFLGATSVAPADFLIAMSVAYAAREKSGAFPASMAIPRDVQLLTARRVAPDAPNTFGGWIIHPPDFRAPKILDVARLQCWTLKPASRRPR